MTSFMGQGGLPQAKLRRIGQFSQFQSIKSTTFDRANRIALTHYPKQLKQTRESVSPVHSQSSASSSATPTPVVATPVPTVEDVRRKIGAGGQSLRRYGWACFWVQLSLTIVASVILMFSVLFTKQTAPASSIFLTSSGIVLSAVSTFWTFGYVSLGRKLVAYAAQYENAKRAIKKTDVLLCLWRGMQIALWGLGMSVCGLQALVGTIVGKTLVNSTANPFQVAGNGSYNPVLALDVLLAQAATNTIMAHFAAVFLSIWLYNKVASQH